MPPKRQPDTQRSLETFFVSPKKAKVDGAAQGKGKGKSKVEGNGNGKGKTEDVIDLETDEEDEIVCVGGSSTAKLAPNTTKTKTTVKAETTNASPPSTPTGKKRRRETTPPVDPASKLFIAQTPTKRRIPPSQTMGLQSPHGTEKVKDEPLVKVDSNPFAPSIPPPTPPLDLDTDPLTFDPRLVDVSGWKATGGSRNIPKDRINDKRGLSPDPSYQPQDQPRVANGRE